MGAPKALLRVGGETFADRLARVFAEAGAHPVLLVLGFEHERVAAGLERASQVELVVNPHPERGQLSSLKEGIRRLPPSTAGTLFCPVDLPLIRIATARLLLETILLSPTPAPVVIPRCRGSRGHPVAIAAGLFPEILSLPATAQARDLIHRYREQTCYLEVDDPGILQDVDTPDDYRLLLAAEDV